MITSKRSLFYVFAICLLACIMPSRVRGGCPPPPRGPCAKCVNGSWVSKCSKDCCYGTCFDPQKNHCCDTNGNTCGNSKICCGSNCCDPDNCQDCNSTTNKCYSLCSTANCLSCDGNGHCVQCGGDPNKACCDGQCYDTRCEACVDGEIVDLCDTDNCEDCNTTVGACQLTCDADDCETCDGAGHCIVCNDDPTKCCVEGECKDLCGGQCCAAGEECCGTSCYDPRAGEACCDDKQVYYPSVQFCCNDEQGTVCAHGPVLTETCCNGSCCSPDECCAEGSCVPDCTNTGQCDYGELPSGPYPNCQLLQDPETGRCEGAEGLLCNHLVTIAINDAECPDCEPGCNKTLISACVSIIPARCTEKPYGLGYACICELKPEEEETDGVHYECPQ